MKSGKDYKRHSALNNLINDFEVNKAYIFNNGNIKIEGKKIYYPIYMIMFLQKEKKIEEQIYIPNISALKL